jgi:hypothetical protein
MQKFKFKTIILLLSIIVSQICFGQATFDPVANQKKVEERRALEKAEKVKIENKMRAHKDSLLAKLPKPYKVKKENPEYSPNSSLSGLFTEFENNKELIINKKILPKIDSNLDEYLNDFTETHKETFVSENDKNIQIELAKKYYTGANIFNNINDTISIDYKNLADILESDRFIYVGNKYIKPKYFYENYTSGYSSRSRLETDENPEIINYLTGKTNLYYADDKYYVDMGENGVKIILQNTKTKLYYIINNSTFQKDYFIDGNIEKLISKPPLTLDEIKAKKASFNLLVTKYREGIKSANINRLILSSIQKKYLTRGYFDSNRVNSIDKKKYNLNLSILNSKANKMKKMQRDEDEDDKALNKLTSEEIIIYVDIMDWKIQVTPIY